SELDTNLERGQLWNITGYANLISKAKEMITSAKREIYLSVWNQELRELIEELRLAEARGIKLVIFSFTDIQGIGQVYSYGLDETELEKVWDHKLLLVCDRQELLMGEANRHIQKKTAWTKNTAIVNIAMNHMVLDITLFGLRTGVDVSQAVIELHPGEFELLDRLLREKYPGNPLIHLDFSRMEPYTFNKMEEAHE
ncbi:MAG: TrmB family transcriptional regulator sugar-binding domain-containing protein, partial [Calditrichia bacterium]